MLADVPDAYVPGARVLEIGGGVGAMQAELLTRGAAEGEVVELVGAYAPYAARLAAAAGVGARSTFRVVDVIDQPQTVKPAAVVILNRVVCCSSEGPDLLHTAARLTSGVLVASFPRSSTLLRVAARAQHLLATLFRRQYRFYVHSPSDLRRAAMSAGLELYGSGRGLIWEYMAFRRPDQSESAAPDISPT